MLGPVETKKCPKCGKNMIKRYRTTFLTYPPQYLWEWWCKCGYRQAGGIERGMTVEEVYEKLWEEVNKARKGGQKC